MSGEWQGWKNWDGFLEAGIVEHSLDFSEEDIIVDHAVGRTKKAIGKCWPIDAAVAYSLMKAGPDAGLTWSDLVNPFTRAASVMMTQKVGYGCVPTPSVGSCGHDEFNGWKVKLGYPKVNDSNQLVWNTHAYGSAGSFRKFCEDNGIEDEAVTKWAEFRLTSNSQGWPTVSWLFGTPAMAPVLDAIREVYGTEWSVNPDINIYTHLQETKGECAWKNESKNCRHHDSPMTTMWAMVRKKDNEGQFLTAWSRRPARGGWNSNMWRNKDHLIVGSNVVSWDEVRRSMAEAVPEHVVIDHIKSSLLRMLKREDNIVSKQGKGRTALHRWSDWGWLAEMAAYVKNTNSKKRKEGDEVNGWVYTKVRSRTSYGHEIADFVWHPKNELKDYLVGRKEKGDYSASAVLTNMRFPSKAQAEAFAASISAAHLENGGFLAHRKHIGFEKEEHSAVSWSIRSITHNIVMHGVVDPEEYLSPEDLHMLARNAAPLVLSEHKEKFEKWFNYNVQQQEAAQDGGQ